MFPFSLGTFLPLRSSERPFFERENRKVRGAKSWEEPLAALRPEGARRPLGLQPLRLSYAAYSEPEVLEVVVLGVDIRRIEA